jgi:replicative DNA helicase
MNERYMMWEEAMTEVRGRAEIIIAKQRHGPTGTVALRFYPEATKFDNLEDDEYGDPRDSGGAPPPGDVPF